MKGINGIRFGWIKDKKDDKDFVLCSSNLTAPLVVTEFTLRTRKLPVWSQLQEGACTGFGSGKSFMHEVYTITKQKFDPSKQFLYNMARIIEGTFNQDAGAMIRDLVKVMVKYGVAPEADFVYGMNNLFKKPSAKAIANALKWQLLAYYSIPDGDINLFKQAIANSHAPVFGALLYTSAMSEATAKTGILTMPSSKESLQGGHCVCAEGFYDKLTATEIYDRKKIKAPKNISKIPGYVEFVNSWDYTWGDMGYGYLPYEYFIKNRLISDRWCLTNTELGK